MVDKQDIIDSLPTTGDVLQVATGDTVSADVENVNNQALLNFITLLFQFVRDDAPSLSETNTWTGTNNFSTIKTDAIQTKTAGGDLTITTTSTGTVKVADATYAAGRVLTTTNVGILAPSATTDMVGANGSIAGVRGLVPAPAAPDNVKALFGDATFKAVVRNANGDMLVTGVPTSGQVPIATGANTGAWGNVSLPLSTMEFRLTLTSGTPITTADVTAATAVYLCPNDGKRILLYDGSALWTGYTSGQLTITPPATTNTSYDVFTFISGGIVTTESVAWTNDTTRATALTYQDGVLVKTGSTNKRYVGSYRTGTVSGQTEDSMANRWVSNVKPIARAIRCRIATPNWSYATNTLRPPNGDSTAGSTRVTFLRGLNERPVELHAFSQTTINNTTGNGQAKVNIGLDSTTTGSAFQAIYPQGSGDSGAYPGNETLTPSARYLDYPSAGYHYLQQLEALLVVAGSADYSWGGGSLNTGMTGIIYV